MMMAAGIGLLDYVWYKTFIFEDFRVIGRPQQVVGSAGSAGRLAIPRSALC